MGENSQNANYTSVNYSHNSTERQDTGVQYTSQIDAVSARVDPYGNPMPIPLPENNFTTADKNSSQMLQYNAASNNEKTSSKIINEVPSLHENSIKSSSIVSNHISVSSKKQPNTQADLLTSSTFLAVSTQSNELNEPPMVFKASSQLSKDNPPVFYATGNTDEGNMTLVAVDSDQPQTIDEKSGKPNQKAVLKRRSYNAMDKREFATKAQELGIRKASKVLGIPRKNLQRWTRQIDELDILVSSEAGRNKKKIREPKGKFPEIEKALVSYIIEETDNNGLLTKSNIQSKAIELFQFYYPESPDVFKATWNWLKGVLLRNHLNPEHHVSDLDAAERELEKNPAIIELPIGAGQGMSTTLQLKCHNCNTDLKFMAVISSIQD